MLASEVLSTFPSPTIVDVIPDTVPVKVGEARGALSANEFVTVEEKLASSFNASANSLRVFNADGAAPTTASIASCTKAVVAICVVSVPTVAVGAAGIPVKVGASIGAKFASVRAVLNSASVPVIVFDERDRVLFVKVCVPVSETEPPVAADISAVNATVPELFGKVIVLSAVASANVIVVSKSSAVAPSITIEASEMVNPEITGEVKVLFVKVSVPVSEATSASVIAVFNCARVAVTVFVPKDIDLFVKVSVVARPTKVSVELGIVTVPVLVIVEITGLVKVLLVRVSVPDKEAKSASETAVFN